MEEMKVQKKSEKAFGILLIGKTGSGKTTIINDLFSIQKPISQTNSVSVYKMERKNNYTFYMYDTIGIEHLMKEKENNVHHKAKTFLQRILSTRQEMNQSLFPVQMVIFVFKGTRNFEDYSKWFEESFFSIKFVQFFVIITCADSINFQKKQEWKQRIINWGKEKGIPISYHFYAAAGLVNELPRQNCPFSKETPQNQTKLKEVFHHIRFANESYINNTQIIKQSKALFCETCQKEFSSCPYCNKIDAKVFFSQKKNVFKCLNCKNIWKPTTIGKERLQGEILVELTKIDKRMIELLKQKLQFQNLELAKEMLSKIEETLFVVNNEICQKLDELGLQLGKMNTKNSFFFALGGFFGGAIFGTLGGLLAGTLVGGGIGGFIVGSLGLIVGGTIAGVPSGIIGATITSKKTPLDVSELLSIISNEKKKLEELNMKIEDLVDQIIKELKKIESEIKYLEKQRTKYSPGTKTALGFISSTMVFGLTGLITAGVVDGVVQKFRRKEFLEIKEKTQIEVNKSENIIKEKMNDLKRIINQAQKENQESNSILIKNSFRKLTNEEFSQLKKNLQVVKSCV